MVAGVHAVEAYLLYPQIYAYRLKLHPLIVMVSTKSMTLVLSSSSNICFCDTYSNILSSHTLQRDDIHFVRDVFCPELTLHLQIFFYQVEEEHQIFENFNYFLHARLNFLFFLGCFSYC